MYCLAFLLSDTSNLTFAQGELKERLVLPFKEDDR